MWHFLADHKCTRIRKFKVWKWSIKANTVFNKHCKMKTRAATAHTHKTKITTILRQHLTCGKILIIKIHSMNQKVWRSIRCITIITSCALKTFESTMQVCYFISRKGNNNDTYVTLDTEAVPIYDSRRFDFLKKSLNLDDDVFVFTVRLAKTKAVPANKPWKYVFFFYYFLALVYSLHYASFHKMAAFFSNVSIRI